MRSVWVSACERKPQLMLVVAEHDRLRKRCCSLARNRGVCRRVGHLPDWGWLHVFDWSLLNAAHDIDKEPCVGAWDGVSRSKLVVAVAGFAGHGRTGVAQEIRIVLLLSWPAYRSRHDDTAKSRGPPLATATALVSPILDFVRQRASWRDRKRPRVNRPAAHAAQQAHFGTSPSRWARVRADGRCCQ